VHALGRQADDLFLHAGRPPSIKRLGKVELLGSTVLDAQAIRELLLPHLSHDQRLALEAKRDVDFSYQLAERDQRFRVNVFAHYTGLGAVFRAVRDEIAGLDALGVPAIVRSFAELPHGLVLVGGPTGAGKSTTLAALIDHMNRSSSRHIVTIEDPIEVVHKRVRSLINQRELGSHTRSFQAALRSTLRQDPDVILVGELRDLDTIAFAVTAAETGHLVLGTVHTSAADATLDRLINAFPTKQQSQVRSMLAESLRAVTCQYLVRTPEGGRALAVEVMINNEAIRSLIRKGKTFQIPSIIATSREHGMQLMDSELLRLVKEGRADLDDAYPKVLDKRAFEVALGLAPLEPVEPGAAGRGGNQAPTTGLSSGTHQVVRSSSPGMPIQPPVAERLSAAPPRIEELDQRSSFPPSRPSLSMPAVSPGARPSLSMPAVSPGARPSGSMPAVAPSASSPTVPAATQDPTSSRAPVRSNNTLFSRPPKPR
jgi:twitching motility protein PilT